uniref:Monooxygenase n=1 Tax=uncultured bacterium BAC-AB1442/1414/561 TaxID=1562172 RepID=A0A0C4SD14_9BACT|nr:monooxygenase [uncultured bacterium BAC-AB1442/1414/561]
MNRVSSAAGRDTGISDRTPENPVRVILWCRQPTAGPADLQAAYHEVSGRLQGTEGLLGNALWESVLDPGGWLVVSEWVSFAAFRRWEQGPEHRAATAPLRPYQDATRSRTYDLYRVRAAY